MENVLFDGVHHDRTDWARMDYVALGWPYATISNDLLQEYARMDYGSGTSSDRSSINPSAIANIVRALNLQAEFYSFRQGDLLVADYCRELKAMVDSLDNLVEPINDHTLLLLSTLNGLFNKFESLSSNKQYQVPHSAPADEYDPTAGVEGLIIEEKADDGYSTDTGNDYGGCGCGNTCCGDAYGDGGCGGDGCSDTDGLAKW
uniref:Uncharacterized protein n=1 Tax=Oryza brachyantha TaxID=4533 RepID=J3MTM4_ORYBR